jgi:RNase H-like domain found in reverse transcriptase
VRWPIGKFLRAFETYKSFELCQLLSQVYPTIFKVVRPITDLLIGMQRGRKAGPFVWTAEADKAFWRLKGCFTTAPILCLFDPSLPIRVEMDASGYAMAEIISQPFVDPVTGRKAWHPIAYFFPQDVCG